MDRVQRHVIMLFALLQGLLYLLLLPPWQHYDEPTHFEYSWMIANRGRFPIPGTVDQVMRREVAASMLQHNFYWNMSKPDILTDAGEINIGISELSHPPLYYLWTSIPLRFARHLDVTTQLYIARAMSLVLFLLTVAIAAGLMRDLTPPGHVLRWIVPLTIALMPPLVDVMTAVNNDVGAVCVFSAFLWGAVRTLRKGITIRRLCWVLGTALLAPITKNTAAVAVVLVPVVFLISLGAQRGWRWPLLISLGSLVTLSVVLVDWATLLSGSGPGAARLRFQPWFDHLLAPYLRLAPSQVLAIIIDLPRIADFLFVTGPFYLLKGFFTGFAWGHVRITHMSFSVLVAGVAFIGVAGCTKWLVRHTFNQDPTLRPVLLFLIVGAAFVWINAMVRTLPLLGSDTIPPTPRYAFPSVIPVALVLAGGWWALWPRRFRAWGSSVLVLLLFGLNAMSVWTIWSFYDSLPAA